MTESCHHPVKSGPKKLQQKAETLETEGGGGVGRNWKGERRKGGGWKGKKGGEFKVCYQALRAG